MDKEYHKNKWAMNDLLLAKTYGQVGISSDIKYMKTFEI